MKFKLIGRLAAVLGLTVALAGCIDVNMDIKVKSDTNADATMSTIIGAQFYPMIKASQTASTDNKDPASEDNDFCKKSEGGVLVENADGSATCTISKSGKFADLSFGEDNGSLTFTSAGPGLVRVSFPTADLSKGVDAATKQDDSADSTDPKAKAQAEQMKQMMIGYFTGHFITIKIEGVQVTDTNMTLSADKRSAEQKIAFTDILNGTAKLPAELYAIVKVN